jgi:hypothetical protein
MPQMCPDDQNAHRPVIMTRLKLIRKLSTRLRGKIHEAGPVTPRKIKATIASGIICINREESLFPSDFVKHASG